MLIETMQKRINEIKQQDRKSYYEIANEIGISEGTLYRLMSKGELFTPAEQKIAAYLKGYLTKDEKLEAYRLDNEKLKAENDRLKEEIKEVKKYQYQQEYLDKEIERLKAEFKIESLTDKTTGETIYRSNLVNKYRTILQEIKTIAEEDCEFCDDIGGCMDKECRRVRILNLITKAEEE